MDLISELPDPILQHILSFLPIKQIVQATILSKRWSHLWFTFPSFEFDTNFFQFEPNLLETKQSAENKRLQLINFVEQTLKQLKCLRKFTLHTDFPGPNSATVVDQWIDYVLKNGVGELEIVVTVENGKRYNLPQRVFANQSLTVLTVGDCKLCPPFEGLKLLSMKRVSLLGVFAEDEIVKRLVSNCPLIEHIKLNSCLGLRSLWLCETNELITMEVQNNSGLYEIGIEAMNLQAFEFRGQFQPCCINISSCKNLKTLKLSMVAIKDDWFHDCISEFPLLEMLALSYCHMLESLRISSPHLKKFILCGCESVTRVHIDTPCLSVLEFSGDVISFSLNAPALSQANVELSPRIFDNPWFVKQIEFLAHFNHLKVLTLQSRTGKTVTVPQELRETFASPLYGVKHLKLKIIKPLFSPSLKDLVEALLWIAPQPDTITIESGFGKKILKFVYEKATNIAVHHCCCASLPITCWKHSLKELKFENIREDEEINNLKNFFHENAELCCII
ncbi:F-box/LRR-repeat protein At3g03360-like [Benincasa hispida]|uniref:F-box/LRR-repeat protein At3g03360-like n=1 Tax=Benincasa hispida TaxID=102211 RepID=UPI00190071CD|nr:F-box/LRR-repeat protein At3g03360-like [Benincasa hispida]